MRNSINYAGFLDLFIDPNDEPASGEIEQTPIHKDLQSDASAKESARQKSNIDPCDQ
jgi:hypothetical protein